MYYSANQVTKSRKLKLARHVATIESGRMLFDFFNRQTYTVAKIREDRSALKILAGKRIARKPLEDLGID